MQPEIVGRAAEIAAIDRLVEHAQDRRACLVFEGEAGIGKTTLWEAARRVGLDRGYQVLSARGAPSESGFPLSGFGDLLLDAAAGGSRLLPGPQRAALEVALLLREPLDAPADQRTVAVATTTLLRMLAEERPILIAIDDIQWLDRTSVDLLSYALRRLQGARIGVIATARGTDEPGDARLVTLDPDAWEEPDRVERLNLGPLSVAALHRLLAARTGTSFSRLAIVRIHAASGGNPFFALEIARALLRVRQPATPGIPLPVPETLAELTTDRVAALPRAARDALIVAALSLEPPTLALLSNAGVVDPREALAPAVAEGVVAIEGDDVRFAHPLLATAVVAGGGPEEVRRAHRTLAGVVGSEEAHARHQALALSEPDSATADRLEAVAGTIRLRGAPIAAGELLELASVLTPSDQADRATGRLSRAAECYFRAGEATRAAALLEQVIAATPAGIERARSLQMLGQVRARSTSFGEALTIAVGARREAGEDALTAAGLELDIAFYSFCINDLGSAVTHAREALPLADGAGLGWVRAEALACVSMAEFWMGRGRAKEQMAEALALEDPGRQGPLEMRPRFVEALLLLWTGDIEASIALLSTLRGELVERGEDTALPFLSLFLVVALLWRGDLPHAGRVAEESAETAALNGEPVARALALSTQALVDALGGPAERARQEASEALAMFHTSHWTIYATWPLWALGLVELSLGNAARVDELLRPLAEGVVAVPVADPILGIVLPDEIEAVAELGDHTRAARYTAWLEQGGRRLDRPWALAAAARGRAIIAAADGDLASAVVAADEAIAQHDRLTMPFERARTLLVKGQVHRRRKEKRLAHDALSEGLRTFEALGAPAWTARARAELARIGLRPRAPAELTETERRVAELVASGLTNRQAASAAFLSPKTVGNVLGRVYRKLGITTRAQLGAVMAVGDHPSEPGGPAPVVPRRRGFPRLSSGDDTATTK